MNRIREFRKEKGIKQASLAKEANISIGYLSHLERGERENPSYAVMKSIANALGKTIGEVFNE